MLALFKSFNDWLKCDIDIIVGGFFAIVKIINNTHMWLIYNKGYLVICI